MTQNKKRERHLTPAGIAIYPRLSAPDKKYKKEYGEYSVKLKLKAEEAEPIIKIINEATEKAYKVECAAQGKTKVKRSVNLPFKAEVDDQEKETGNVIFMFKLPGGGKAKATGVEYTLKPQIFDKYGKELKEDVWGGSTIRVSFEMRPYFTDGLGFGMTLRIAAVQVLALVSRGAGTADSYGFAVEESEDMPEGDDAGDEPTEAKGPSNGAQTAADKF